MTLSCSGRQAEGHLRRRRRKFRNSWGDWGDNGRGVLAGAKRKFDEAMRIVAIEQSVK
jgi:hypothetical protein